MITIIAGTNRRNSMAYSIAKQYLQCFKKYDQEVQLLNLENLPPDFLHPDMYSSELQQDSFAEIQRKYIIAPTKFFFVVSEYNGGFPGILKLFIDACSTQHKSESFHGKKAGMTGISSGRAGCLRGMDHLASILNYLQLIILPNMLPISSIHTLMNSEGRLIDEATLQAIDQQVLEFIQF